MLAGVKFIPQDQLHTPNSGSSDGDSEEERKGSRGSKKKLDGSKHGRRGKPRYGDASDEDGGKRRSEKHRRKKKNKRGSKKRYSSDDASETSSEGNSENFSDSHEYSRPTRRGRRRDEDSDSSSDGYEEKKSGKIKHSRKKRDKGKVRDIEDSSDDAGDMVPKNDNEVARKEMGLEWMLRSGNKAEKRVVEVEDEPEKPQAEEVKITNPRELNPYLRNNGNGYPNDSIHSEAGADKLLPSSVVGDGGASWRLKALKRAKEQAARKGQDFAEVVKERWGSLGQLAESMSFERAAPTHAHLQAIRHRKKGQTEEPKEIPEELHGHSHGYLRDVSSRHPEMKRPKNDSLAWKKNKVQDFTSKRTLDAKSNDKKFLDDILHFHSKVGGASDNSQPKIIEDNLSDRDLVSDMAESSESALFDNQGLSANKLAAKVMQLRMKGKHEEADKLSKEVDAIMQKQEVGNKIIRQENSGSANSYINWSNCTEQKKEDDADLHLARRIMSNRQYSLSGRADEEYDFDGEPSRKSKRKREARVDDKRVIPRHILTQQERCNLCFECPSRPKHLAISIANFTYMMLPQYQPIVQGHCCILPMQHESATRTVDNNVWEEIRNFKKCLIRMFARQNKELVFFETVIGLAKQRRHCLVECVPIPSELSNQAPLYFKKAIDEAEDEWGQHEMKKLIQTSGNLRHVIPENFSYFHVEFGLDRGFVHVIEDDSNFRSSFGLNVIRGLLRLPEEDMHRRRRHEPLDKQKHAVAAFAREWEPFDWTKELE